MDFQAILSIVIFVVVLGIIISEKMNRTIIAITGAVIIVITRLIMSENVAEFVDFNTLGVLSGMMIIVGILKTTGAFEYVSIVAAKLAKGNPWKIILSFCIITAVTSALLDNVTTVLLIAPMTLGITAVLELDPIPFLIPQIIASNIGGTATLIGDPPNIMIGSAADIGFLDFIENLTPVIIVVFIVTMMLFKVIYGKKLVVSEKNKKKILAFDEKKAIQNLPLLVKSIIVLILVILGFFLHEELNYSSGLVAISGAVLLVLISGITVEETLENIEWPTIFFFVGLFVVVGGLEATGVIEILAEKVLDMTNGNLMLTGIVILWMSAIISAFLDNIPFVAALIPLIQHIGSTGQMDVMPLWWAISLGACLGGNGTIIGASANVVVAGLAERQGHKISYGKYIRTGFPMMVISVFISMIYLIIFYFH